MDETFLKHLKAVFTRIRTHNYVSFLGLRERSAEGRRILQGCDPWEAWVYGNFIDLCPSIKILS